MLDNDIVTQYFRGRTRSIITYQDEDNKSCSHEKIEQSFAAIMVGVIGFKDLYSAWENQIISTIPDYKAEDDSDYKVDAEQSEYLEVAPKVICLQMNRLEYKDGEQIKHRHKVDIEKTIMLDRFMLFNKEKHTKIRSTV